MTEETRYATLDCHYVPHDLVLTDIGPDPLAVTRAYAAIASLGLWRAKQAVTATPPVTFVLGLPESDVLKLVHRLREAGATADAVPQTGS
ncbi:ribosomal protein L7/L12 [Kitasatospora sp. NPDC096147]|uniref:ribosomal protein L7/L12 n=1 Tax=Kitasatospora sp. NPDC096147 TaxID=3364093 RepID=UPI003820314A